MTPSADAPRRPWLTWWGGRGAASQALIPGLYAWAVTSLPVGWAPGASAAAATATAAGLGCLLAGSLVERRWPEAARLVSGWGLVVACVVVWVVGPEARVRSFDAARGIAGMVGWALFAFAVGAPARTPRSPWSRAPAPARVRRSRMGLPVLAGGLLVALILQVPGWRVAQADRALLVRIVSVAGALGAISVAAAIAAGSRGRDRVPERAGRLRRAAWAAVVAVLLGAGAAYDLWQQTPPGAAEPPPSTH